MELVGSISNLTLDFHSGKPIVSILCEEKAALHDVESYKDKRLRIDMRVYRERRTLSQNDYFHVLLGKLADAMGVSKPFMKNFLLRRYGQYDTIDGKLVEFILREELSDDVDQWENVHLYPTDHITTMANGKLYRLFYKLKGSHEMNTAECNVLIDGTISECREAGIVTDTPAEIERLKALWGA